MLLLFSELQHKSYIIPVISVPLKKIRTTKVYIKSSLYSTGKIKNQIRFNCCNGIPATPHVQFHSLGVEPIKLALDVSIIEKGMIALLLATIKIFHI